MKYQLLLKDFVKCTAKAGLDTTELKVGPSPSLITAVMSPYSWVLLLRGSNVFIYYLCTQKALDMMYVVPKKANDMMNVGMLEGYTVKKRTLDCLFLQLVAIFINFISFQIILRYFVLICLTFSLLQGKIAAQGQLIMQVTNPFTPRSASI